MFGPGFAAARHVEHQPKQFPADLFDRRVAGGNATGVDVDQIMPALFQLAARGVSRWMASRTSVTSENITVAPARTSRSAANPSAGLAVTPEKASLPPHCIPTTSADAGQVSR